MSGNAQKKAIYTEIAKAAGVSISTVSRVLNNREIVRRETVDKVYAAMESFGYNINELAYRPQAGAGLLVLNLPSLNNPFYSEIVQGAKAAAANHGYKLLVNVEHINQDTFSSCLDVYKRVKAAGLITLNHIPPRLLTTLEENLPLVQCNEYDEAADISFVSIDDVTASIQVIQHILTTGKRKIAFIDGPNRYKYSRHRLQGYLTALNDAGIGIDEQFIMHMPEIDYGIAVTAIAQLFNSANRPDALFAASDVFAAAAVRAIKSTGLSIPQDVVVVGFDNVEYSVITNPTITTVSQPKFQLGFTACELLVEKIRNPATPKREVILNTELIVRESTSIFL